ncbi:Crp/Fnr family transcriptional regulator [Sphingobacterium sp. G1-14]|nr:Crp/Fnr family transcriptional regulator [Sphingobacterium sp. G1-14]
MNKSNSQQLNYFNLGLTGIKQLVKLALQNFVFYSQMEQFKEFVKQRIDVTEEELNDIVSRYQVRKIKKKEYFLRAGEVCHHEAYVISGLFKSFYVTADGIEHILQFAIEDWWIGDIASFNYQEPALQNIQALENAVVLTLSKKNKDKLYEDHPIFEKLSRIMAQRAQIASQHRIISSIGFTAQERYLDFIKRYPKIYPRISNMQLASYLGVTQEFLSRLKRQILKPNRNS